MRGNFNEFFNISDLSEQRLGNIEFVLNSPAYESDFKPFMLGIVRSVNKLWRDRSRERQDRYPDEYLAGGADFGEGLITFFDQIIQETQIERMHRAQIMNPETEYAVRRERGEAAPIVGFDQKATPTTQIPPEEDY